MRIVPSNSVPTAPQIEPKEYPKPPESRIGYLITKNIFRNTDLRALFQLRLVCKAWRIGFDSYMEKPWQKLNMLEIIQGNNCIDLMVLYDLDIDQKIWSTWSSIQKVFFMPFAMPTQPNPAKSKLTLSQLYSAHRKELTFIKRVLTETNALAQVTKDFLDCSFEGKPIELSLFYKGRLRTDQESFIKLHLLRRSFKVLEYPFTNFSNFLFIGKTSSNERSETFFLYLLDLLKKYTHKSFKPKNSALFDSLDAKVSEALKTSATAKELKRALHLYPLNPKTLILLSIIAFLECQEGLAQDITASINQPENHTMALRSYFAALILFTQSSHCRVQVVYLLNQIRQFPMATINGMPTPVPLVNILASKHVPVEDLKTFLEAGLDPNPIGQAPSPLCNDLSLERYNTLLMYHANPNHRPPEGKTVFQFYLEKETAPLILVQLLNHGANFTLIPVEIIYKNILALFQRTLDQIAQHVNLVTILRTLFAQIPEISERYPELIFLMLLIDSSYVWKSTHPQSVDISQFDPLIKNHKKHLSEAVAEKLGRVLFGFRIRASDLVSFTYDPLKALAPEIRCAILKGHFKAQADEHRESRLILKLNKEELEQILSCYYDQSLLNLLLDRIFHKTSELQTHILTLARNRHTALTQEVLQSIAVRGFDLNSIPPSKIAPGSSLESFLNFQAKRKLEDEKENHDLNTTGTKRRKLGLRDTEEN